MKNRKKHVTVFLFAMMMLLTAGCGGYEDLPPLPTLAPTPTAEPEVDAPAPTAAPDAEYTKIVELDGEDYNQTSYFTIEGEGSVSVKPVSKSGRYSFCMSGRGESWHGISFPVADASGNEVNVVGKNVFMSMWVYHESGKPESFTCSMQIKKPDGTTDSPIEITKNGVPSHTWTLIEGYLPVYANVTSPRIRMEMTSGNASFYFDDFRLTYDPNSSIMAKQEYNVVSFEGLYFDFENGENPFVGRAGTESLEIIKGGLDGKKCLSTTKRTANWHGPSIDLTEYGLAGVPIWVSFSATQGGSGKATVKCTIQELPVGVTDESKASYTQIVSTQQLAPGEWATVTGKYTLKANTERAILYFETDQTEDILIDNILISAKDPTTIEIDKETGEVEDKVQKIDTSNFINLYTLTADGVKDQTSTFILNDSATVANDSNGHTENAFKVSNRAANWAGVGIHLANDGYAEQVIGKEVYVSFWVYQESGETLDFSATLQANKPDGTQVWPERVSLEVLPSGKWIYVEGMIPIYANVKVPQINFEMPSSPDAEYYIDDLIISYNPDSNVAPNQAYAEAESSQHKEKLDRMVLDFENNDAFFIGRGDGKPTIEYGGYKSDMCLHVSGRTQNWHGVVADFSKYDIIGKTLNISFWMYHEYDTPLEIILSAEQNDGSNTTYANIVPATGEANGKWARFSGSYTVPEGIKKIYLYFESQNVTAEFYLDDIVIEVE